MRVPSSFSAALCMAALAAAHCGCSSLDGQMNNQMGLWSYQQGNYIAARENFRRAVADNPQNATFVYNFASVSKRLGDLATAERTYVQAISLDRTHQPSYHGLVELLNEEGRQAESAQMISAWAASQPNHGGAQVELAWVQRQNGDRSGAEQSLYRALALRPNDPIATAQLGQIYQEAGQSERAAAMYQRSLRSNWAQPQVEERLASLRNAGGFNGPARTMVEPPSAMMASNFGPPGVYGPPAVYGAPAVYGQPVMNASYAQPAVPPQPMGPANAPMGSPTPYPTAIDAQVASQVNADPGAVIRTSGVSTLADRY